MTQLCGQKNEVGFKCQRSLLQVPMKPASLGIEACCVFETLFSSNIRQAHPINIGDYQLRPAWKAVHIGFADVGNRVHTRNDSNEDVRGYACKQAIAWKALPWSFIT